MSAPDFSAHSASPKLLRGLAAYLDCGDKRLELMISPVISEEDREQSRRAVTTPEEVAEAYADLLFEEARLSQACVVRHAVQCLAYLLAANRLDLRFVLMTKGQYHKKEWLIRSGEDWLAVHGSGNATTRGLLVNGENMTIDRPWAGRLRICEPGPKAAGAVGAAVGQQRAPLLAYRVGASSAAGVAGDDALSGANR